MGSHTTESGAPDGAVLRQALELRYGALAVAESGSLGCGRAVALADAGPGERVVDLGCGRGADLLTLLAATAPDGLVLGLDRSPAMLEQAARRLHDRGTGRGLVLRGELQALPLASASWDLLTSNCTVNHAPDKLAVYREIHRVLRPGGRFVIADIVAEQELPAAVRSDPAAWAGCYGGAVPEAEYLAVMRRAGFGRIELLTRSEPYARGGVWLRSVTVRGWVQQQEVDRW